MTVYELFKTVHVLSIATWFGSSLAVMVVGSRLLAARGTDAFSGFLPAASWWAGRAHPAAGALLLLTGFAMIGDAGIAVTEPWILIPLIGLVITMGLGGAVIGRTANELVAATGGGPLGDAQRPLADRLMAATRIELVLLVAIIAVMVIKPGA